MDELVAILEDLAVEVRLDERQDVLEQRVERRLVRSDRRHTEGRPLEKILVPDLGRGDFELVADPGLQALDDHPFLFQAATARQVKIKHGVGEDHKSFQLTAFS